jgi:hypothetical protein
MKMRVTAKVVFRELTIQVLVWGAVTLVAFAIYGVGIRDVYVQIFFLAAICGAGAALCSSVLRRDKRN